MMIPKRLTDEVARKTIADRRSTYRQSMRIGIYTIGAEIAVGVMYFVWAWNTFGVMSGGWLTVGAVVLGSLLFATGFKVWLFRVDLAKVNRWREGTPLFEVERNGKTRLEIYLPE